MTRDNKSTYLRRNQLARQRGFKSYAQQRRHNRVPTTESQLRDLPDDARAGRAEALDVINAARRQGVSVVQAAADRRVPLASVVWWGAPALEAPRSKSPGLRKADRLLRVHPLIIDGELQIVTTRGSNAARTAQNALRVQRAFLDGEPGAREALVRLAGVQVGGHVVETDPDVLEEIGRRGELGDIGEMYRAWLS